MPSGCQSFSVHICPVQCRPSDPFRHLRCPTYHLLPSHISSTAVSIHVVPHLCHHARLLLSSPLTLSSVPIILHLQRASILSSHVSVVVLIALSSIVLCTSPSLFVYLLRIRYSPRSMSFCTTLLAPLFSKIIFSLSSLIFSLHFYFLFWHGSSLSLRDFLSSLRDAAFFSSCLHSALLQSDHSPQLCLIRSA